MTPPHPPNSKESSSRLPDKAKQPSLRAYGEMFVARGFALIGPFGVAIVTARVLGPEDRGRYYYVITLAAVGAQLASLGIHASNGYLVSRQPELLPRILANSAWIALVGGGAAACGVVLFDVAVGDALHRLVLAAVVLTAGPLVLLFLYLSNLAVAMDRPGVFNVLAVFGSVAALFAALVVALAQPTLNAFLFASVTASALTCWVAWWWVSRGHAVPWSFDRGLFRQGLSFALRAHVAALAGFLMARTGIIILRYQGAFGDVGQWSIAAQVADALLLLPATIGLLLFPALVRASDHDRWTGFLAMLLRVGILMAVICVIAGIAARPLIIVVFGAAYAPAADITLALLPGIFFLSLATVASQFLSAFGIPRMQVIAWIVCWGIQVALSLTVLQSYGALGLAWTQSACAGLVCLLLLIKALDYSPRKLQPR